MKRVHECVIVLLKERLQNIKYTYDVICPSLVEYIWGSILNSLLQEIAQRIPSTLLYLLEKYEHQENVLSSAGDDFCDCFQKVKSYLSKNKENMLIKLYKFILDVLSALA